jgi:dCMP deaminase
MPKREDYISWDEYFMGVSLLSSMRSKDPSTQVGACIVSDENKILSVGYNGFPRGCSDDEFPWERSADKMNNTKYPFVCHAELNAILNAGGQSLAGARIFVALFPCNECAKAIIQSGIKEVIYISDKYANTEATIASKKMLNSAGVKLTQFNSDKTINISFKAETI